MFISKDDYNVYLAETGEQIKNVIYIEADYYTKNGGLIASIAVWFLDEDGKLVCENGESNMFRFRKKEGIENQG